MGISAYRKGVWKRKCWGLSRLHTTNTLRDKKVNKPLRLSQEWQMYKRNIFLFHNLITANMLLILCLHLYKGTMTYIYNRIPDVSRTTKTVFSSWMYNMVESRIDASIGTASHRTYRYGNKRGDTSRFISFKSKQIPV